MFSRGLLKSNAAFILALFHLLDPLVVVVCSFILRQVISGEDLGHYQLIRILTVYGPVLILFIFPFFQLYKSWRGKPLWQELYMLLLAWGTVLLIFNAFILLLANREQLMVLWPYGLFMVEIFWVWAIGCLAMMSLMRILVREALRLLRRLGYNQRTAVVAGAGLVGKNVAAYLEKQAWTGIRIAGFFDDYLATGEEVEVGLAGKKKVLGTITDCYAYCRGKKPAMVIIALPMRAEKKIHKLVWELGTHGIAVYLVPDLFIYGLHKASLQQVGDIPIMSFNLFPAWKRVFDLIFSLAVLVALIPLFAVIAFFIKREDGGPVFYNHKRIGESGAFFYCLKFRTMHVDADKRLTELLQGDPALRQEWAQTQKLKNYPRVTRIGRFLRKTSLDELPQFVNVVRGEMSVVGARPIVSEELFNHYKDTAITYCAMKPGITGPWQVGMRSDTEDYSERVDLDRHYILNASIGGDLVIILKTFLKIFNGRGAY